MNPQIIPATIEHMKSIVQLSYQKRRNYEKAQPLFWQYAEGAEEIQAKWFGELLTRDDHIILVAKSNKEITGFIIGRIVPCPEVYAAGLTLMIDDFCVASPHLWDTVGSSLVKEIRAIAQTKYVKQIVVVSGHHDDAKRKFLKDIGLNIASEWYVGSL